MLRHVFLWSVKDGVDGEHILARLAELEHRVSGLRGFAIGRHEGEMPNADAGTWRYALTCDFEDRAQLDRYTHHPEHERIIAEVADSYLNWLVLDFVL